MTPVISKEELNELEKIKGEAVGAVIKPGSEFILKEEGEEGLKKLEETLAELGYPVKYDKIKLLDFYPLKMIAITLVAAKRLFNFDDKKLRELGEFSAKVPFLVRMFIMGRFFSIEGMKKEAPRIWKKYFTVSDLKITEFNEEKKYMILIIENFVYIAFYCRVLEGFLSNILKMVVRKPVSCEETKCIHRGDEYHEFLLKW